MKRGRARSYAFGMGTAIWRVVVLSLSALVLPAITLKAQTYEDGAQYDTDFSESLPAIDARVWFDRGNDPLFDTGDRVRVYFRTSEDAYVAIFHIDTDGRTRLVFPTNPTQRHYIRGGRDYRTLFDDSQHWYVNDAPGQGYFFIVASAAPMDFSRIPYSTYDREWDLTRVGSEVRSDPYLAMDGYVADLIPDWEYGEYGLDYAEYSVDSRHAYPRFMCYDCHGYRPYNAWNPYAYSCTTFRVVLWDDPFYYPSTRYRGDRVVFVGRRPGTRPRFEFKERGRGDDGRRSSVETRSGPQRTALRRSDGRGSLTSPPSNGAGSSEVTRRRGTSTPPNAAGRPRTTDRPAATGRNGSPALRRSGGERANERPQATRGTDAVRRPSSTRPSTATRPSTRFRDDDARTRRTEPDQSTPDTPNGASPRAAPTRGSTPDRARPSGSERAPVVRGRPATGSRTRPQLERRRPTRGSTAAPSNARTRSQAQGRQRTPAARPNTTRSRPNTARPTTTRTRPNTTQPNTTRTRPNPGPSRAQPRATVRPPQRSQGSSRAQPRRPSGSATPSRSAPARSRPTPRPRRKPGGDVGR